MNHLPHIQYKHLLGNSHAILKWLVLLDVQYTHSGPLKDFTTADPLSTHMWAAT